MYRATSTLLVIVLTAVAGCAGTGALLGPEAAQGIDGLVLLGPMCPVQQAGDSCPDQPYQAWLDVLDSAGRQVTRIRSDASGHFRVGLAPGGYLVHPESGNPLPRASDEQVNVARGAYTSVTVTFDTGIR